VGTNGFFAGFRLDYGWIMAELWLIEIMIEIRLKLWAEITAEIMR
jgi:hypothetical protein